MAANIQMFLFLFKSKYRRKCYFCQELVYVYLIFLYVVNVSISEKCETQEPCVNGRCNNDTCVCFDGWRGKDCNFCASKIRLNDTSGYILDGTGNYSTDVKCSWLIESKYPNATIRLHLEEFATECGWDHLYIYDGDSVDKPLLAVFSGLMYHGNYSIRKVPEVVAHSGSVLLHFYSDIAYNMSGFNISYRINSCPSNSSSTECSGHGVCIQDGVCTCDASYMGEACNIPKCPNNCSGENGECDRENHRCNCKGQFRGEDCSQVADLGYWEVIRPSSFVPEGSSSHGAVIWGDTLWIVGGESYNRAVMLYKYDFNGNVWETPRIPGPLPRYGHSTVVYGDKIYMYGGVLRDNIVTNELWAFDIGTTTAKWENITVQTEYCNITLCGPLRSAGHSATIVSSKAKKSERMVVIFGHSPIYGYLNYVQEYYFGTREWNIVQTRGYPVKGGYGHSSAWDPITQKIYVYGGHVSENPSTTLLSSAVYSYDPNLRIWSLLTPSPSARFLHSAVITQGLMLVFGGNTHNDTAISHGAKCYSSDFLAYDILCDSWSTVPVPDIIGADLPRYGHSAAMFEGSVYIYGGFDGQMLSDLLKYTPGNCESFSEQTCLNRHPGVKCVWNSTVEKCEVLTSHRNRNYNCANKIRTADYCSRFLSCVACVQTSYQCVWCGKTCSYKKCEDVTKGVSSLELCEANDAVVCQQFHNCHACSVNPQCHWNDSGCKIIAGNTTEQVPESTCPSRSCSEFTNCINCTIDECIWCQNLGRCIDKNAYTASFPYGQCREWTTHQARCRSTVSGKSSCSFYPTCEECRADPACGWCDNGSGTGLGMCLPGGSREPKDPKACSSSRWYFTHCPECQCNGHSTCTNESDILNGNNTNSVTLGRTKVGICKKPCANLTKGDHCEQCEDGYFGNPVNGGRCKPCECNHQGTKCNHETGKCFCTTKGITGDSCERCDTQNMYFGDPTTGSSCFYNLNIDFQFTFNLSKKEDKHYTQINFKNTPPKPDVDVEFQITCSVTVKINITSKTGNGPEKLIPNPQFPLNCTSHRIKFSKTEYNFGSSLDDNSTLTTFYVYVYDLQPPLWIQVSFSQYPKLNLQQFFITFSTCFLLLLLVAAILWKIKQKYDMYRRRQRLFVEMEKMASRPFSQVLVAIEQRECNDTSETSDIPVARKRKKDSPSPIALEPCCGNRAAVLSLLIRLPTGGETYTPPGQSGLAIASALVTLGNPRKVSIDPTGKSDGKSKSRKSVTSQHPDSCI